MTVGQLPLALLIEQGLHYRSGNDFQSTAQGILRHRIGGFQAVEPYGKDGDGGNDGFSQRLGVYAQFFAPSSKTDSSKEAAKKAARDFAKLKGRWEAISPIREYLFVMNTKGTNIHVEHALAEIRRKHRVKARFLGLSELSDEAKQLDHQVLHALMGITIAGDASGTTDLSPRVLELLSSVEPKQFEALHLLASVPLVTTKLCEDLLPVVHWKIIWPWLLAGTWATKDEETGYIRLDDEVEKTCRKNSAAQTHAAEQWVGVLSHYGSIDCVFLSLMPFVTLHRFADAVRALTHAGLYLTGSEWDGTLSEMATVFSEPKILKKLGASERVAFDLAKANLLSAVGKDADAFEAFKRAFKSQAKWPRKVERELLTLNFGVCAHRVGDMELAEKLYRESAALARTKKHDWVLGRVTSNLSQMVLSEDSSEAEALIQESEAAKKRAGDTSGLLTVQLIRGLLAAENDDEEEASKLFADVKRRAPKDADPAFLTDVSFNLGKSLGEQERWKEAAREHRDSFQQATRAKDNLRAARARGALAEAYFHLKRWDWCRKECEALASLPEDDTLADFRLMGMHGRFALAERSSDSRAKAFWKDTLAFAEKTKSESWIGRLIVDRVIAKPGHVVTNDELKGLIASAVAQRKAKRFHAAGMILRAVWQSSVTRKDRSAIETEARSLLDRIVMRSKDPGPAIELLKWQYNVLSAMGEPWRAARCLEICERVAGNSGRWAECAAVLDERGVVMSDVGRPELGEPLHRRALKIATGEKLARQRRLSASNLAECLRRLGRLRDALRQSEKALSLCDEESGPQEYLRILHNHHLIESDLGQKARARKTLSRCESLARRHHIHSETVRAYMARGSDAWEERDLSRSLSAYRSALKEAERHGLSEAAADCRYNIADTLRRKGKPEEGLRILEKVIESRSDSIHAMDRARLFALLYENAFRPREAGRSWSLAATVARRLRSGDEAAYFETRAVLAKRMATESARKRASLADLADRLLSAIHTAPNRMAEIVARTDKATAFFGKEKFPAYRVAAYQAAARKLSASGGKKNLVAAAESSLASVLSAIEDTPFMTATMVEHMEWLTSLGLSLEELDSLRVTCRKWLVETIGTTLGMKLVEDLLKGFTLLRRVMTTSAARPA